MQQWVEQRQLRHLSVNGPGIDGFHAYMFDAARLQQWRHERLTFSQARRLLSVSKATLHRWIQQGKLVTLDDMGGKQRWFARAEVERLNLDPRS